MDFFTLGMFIIDDIYPTLDATDQKPRLAIPGGAGTYSALGARIACTSPDSRKVGWIVDCGTDFPSDLRETITSWETGVLLRSRDALTTRAWNGYSGIDHRDFRYLTPKMRLDESDLMLEALHSKSIHMVCSQERCISLIKGIERRRQKEIIRSTPAPMYVYEPIPDCAIEANLKSTFDTIDYVDVLSPNHEELASLFGVGEKFHDAGLINRSLVEECVTRLLDVATTKGRCLIVVVRAGREGSYTARNGTSPTSFWLPPYHTNQDRVVDPTGGGNGFLGGFAVALARTNDVRTAVCWGNITASFCIEQVGIPVLTRSTVGEELWNGCSPQKRLREYQATTTRQRT